MSAHHVRPWLHDLPWSARFRAFGRRMAFVALTAATLTYPALVYISLDRFEARATAWLLMGVALARACYTGQRVWWWCCVGAVALALSSVHLNELLPLKLYPVLVNVALLFMFGASLVRPPTLVERMARLADPNLESAAVAYTRQVTKVWCAFFLVNGSIALCTALFASDKVWALYNGFIAYILMGALFAGEWLVRRFILRHSETASLAPVQESAHE